MKHHECTCIQCCNARTVVKPKGLSSACERCGRLYQRCTCQPMGLNSERWRAELEEATRRNQQLLADALDDASMAAHVAKYPDTFSAWLPSAGSPPSSFFGLDRSKGAFRIDDLVLPKVRWWTRMRWKLGRWLSRGDPSA